MSKVIFIHLLQNPKSRGKFDPFRIGGLHHDWDLVTCINELRRYINGGLPERKLKAFLEKSIRIHRFKGLMSFYPLVTHVEQFAALDGWLISALRRALRERSKVLAAKFVTQVTPLSEKMLISGDWYKFQSGIELETSAPSFVLAWRAARKSFKQYGLLDFEQPSYYSMMDFGGHDYDE